MPCTRCKTLGIECTIPKTVKRGRPSRALLEQRRMLKELEELEEQEVAPSSITSSSGSSCGSEYGEDSEQ